MLLSYKYKFAGIILILIGLVLSILYFSVDFRFEIPVFALVSSYMETRFFTSFSTNFADELIFLTLITGFSLLVFSKEKNESRSIDCMRSKALVYSARVYVIFLIFSVLFFYGSSFIGMLILNLFSPFIFYLSIFYFLKIGEKKTFSQKTED
jgi:hypothetical protein